MSLLSVQHLSTQFTVGKAHHLAVDDVSFHVRAGETLGLVGESGCGKTTTGFSILRLLPPNGRVSGGSAVFHGEDLFCKTEEEMRAIRGNRVSMIFQDPMTSLNPALRVGDQIGETLVEHKGLSRRQASTASVEWLRRVGIPAAEMRARRFPHEFSGGMRQRVVIAIALSCHPELVIADEPTSALDVTVQAQILRLLTDLTREARTAVILITHDLGLVAQLCDRVVVMYAGRIVETGPVKRVFREPKHPYTVGLLQSLPSRSRGRGFLPMIPGSVPRHGEEVMGCRFHPRCSYVMDRCRREDPELVNLDDERSATCFLNENR